jgi:hypothetical protein
VFVTGATGYVGQRVIPVLLDRGHRVAALVRSGSVSKAPRGCEIVVGDPFDRWTFVKAIARGDTVLQLVGVPRPSPAKAQRFLDIDLRSARESLTSRESSKCPISNGQEGLERQDRQDGRTLTGPRLPAFRALPAYMALAPGTRLGPYEIVAVLGAGRDGRGVEGPRYASGSERRDQDRPRPFQRALRT